MFYAVLQRLVRIIYRIYFRRIYFHNAEVVPSDKPVLLACNHPSAAVEPALIGLYMPHQIYYITRGDIADKPKLLWFFEATNQIPIYRFRDGFSNLKKNMDSFAFVFKKLAANKTIIIFAEGLCIQEKKLRPLQKGLGKMAFGAFEDNQVRDTLVIPVCVNFSAVNTFRSDVQASFGTPIPIEKYLETYQEQPNRALRLLTDETQHAMKELIVHIERNSDEPYVDQLTEIAFHNAGLELAAGKYLSDTRLQREIKIANRFNALDDEEREQIMPLIDKYKESLNAHKLKDEIVQAQGQFAIWKILPALLLLPVAAWAWITNQIPFRVSRSMAEKLPKTIEFYPSIRIFSFIFFALVQFLILTPILVICCGWYGLLIALSIPITGYWLMPYWEMCLQIIRSLRYRNLNKQEQANLSNLRADIQQKFPLN
ncbi:MAG: 1-acyl-sn-glycerol-3-phosphate acyltransferase [Saprospiraceae bacterium]